MTSPCFTVTPTGTLLTCGSVNILACTAAAIASSEGAFEHAAASVTANTRTNNRGVVLRIHPPKEMQPPRDGWPARAPGRCARYRGHSITVYTMPGAAGKVAPGE